MKRLLTIAAVSLGLAGIGLTSNVQAAGPVQVRGGYGHGPSNGHGHGGYGQGGYGHGGYGYGGYRPGWRPAYRPGYYPPPYVYGPRPYVYAPPVYGNGVILQTPGFGFSYFR